MFAVLETHQKGLQRSLAGLSRRRNQAELLHEAHDIPLVPVFDELTIGEAVDGDARHRHLLASRGDMHRRHHITDVGATKCPARHVVRVLMDVSLNSL